ncbi:MAG: hypothetical protein P8098_16490 [Candidatus Thiodiazotropha sp.]
MSIAPFDVLTVVAEVSSFTSVVFHPAGHPGLQHVAGRASDP